MSLTCYSQGMADYYAWSDQDDIWHEDKLDRAVGWLSTVPAEVSALYCGRTQLVSEDNHELGLSVRFSRQPTFANALMQNIGGGNTMVFNEAACLPERLLIPGLWPTIGGLTSLLWARGAGCITTHPPACVTGSMRKT